MMNWTFTYLDGFMVSKGRRCKVIEVDEEK
jgi:hypothetical protein